MWGFGVELLCRMRRVQCRSCGVKVEQVPWAAGKHTLTRAYMLHLAHWARKLSWQETARSFRTGWEQVCHGVEYVVQWGLEHRQLHAVKAIGVEPPMRQKSCFITSSGSYQSRSSPTDSAEEARK